MQAALMETEKPFDALIIGSGIGGLSTGIILSRLHQRVAVIEKNPLPGGLMRSYARDGVDCPVGVHYFGAFGEGQPLRRMFDYLGVTERWRRSGWGRAAPSTVTFSMILRSICRKGSMPSPRRWKRRFRRIADPSRRSSEISAPWPICRIPSPFFLRRRSLFSTWIFSRRLRSTWRR